MGKLSFVLGSKRHPKSGAEREMMHYKRDAYGLNDTEASDGLSSNMLKACRTIKRDVLPTGFDAKTSLARRSKRFVKWEVYEFKSEEDIWVNGSERSIDHVNTWQTFTRDTCLDGFAALPRVVGKSNANIGYKAFVMNGLNEPVRKSKKILKGYEMVTILSDYWNFLRSREWESWSTYDEGPERPT